MPGEDQINILEVAHWLFYSASSARGRRKFPALAWSLLYVIAIFLAYYVLRPIRDEFGLAGGVDNLPWLFTGTFVTMLAASPLFAYAVRRFPGERFVAISHRFFSANLIVFTALLSMSSPNQQIWIGRAFFIWVSVFNLFVVSIFWSFIVDIFNGEQGKRLFGVVAAGATLGGLLAPSLWLAGTHGRLERELAAYGAPLAAIPELGRAHP